MRETKAFSAGTAAKLPCMYFGLVREYANAVHSPISVSQISIP